MRKKDGIGVDKKHQGDNHKSKIQIPCSTGVGANCIMKTNTLLYTYTQLKTNAKA